MNPPLVTVGKTRIPFATLESSTAAGELVYNLSNASLTSRSICPAASGGLFFEPPIELQPGTIHTAIIIMIETTEKRIK
jgi:hypothetical protein